MNSFKGSAHEESSETMITSQEFDNFISTDPSQLTENTHWGDACMTKSDKSIRIYFQNIHGITSDNKWHKW